MIFVTLAHTFIVGGVAGLAGAILGYAFRGAENKAIVAAAGAASKAVGTVASDIQKKL